MKQLTDKEMAILGMIGHTLEDDHELWSVLQEKLVDGDYREQLEVFSERMFDATDFELEIKSILLDIFYDIIGEDE